MAVERVLLQVLRFDLIVEHPYKYIQPYLAAEKVPQEAQVCLWGFAQIIRVLAEGLPSEGMDLH